MTLSISPDTAFPLHLDEHLAVMGHYFFNLYLFRGRSKTALVETGVSAVVDRVIAQLEALDAAPDYLVITHPHPDHITGLDGLTARYPKAQVVAATGAQGFATHPKALANTIREDAFTAKALDALGIAPGRAPVDGFAFPEAVLEVDGEADLDLGGLHLRCLAGRGHAPGSLLVHCPENRAVTVSDSLGFHFPGSGFLPMFFTGYADFLATLKKIIALRPQIVGPGHQGPFTGTQAAKALETAHEATVALLDRIRSDRRKDEIIAEELFEENYRDEFTLYSPENIRGCCRLLVRRAREHDAQG